MLYEQKLIDELKRFETDEHYAREKCELPAEGKLDPVDQNYYESEKPKWNNS